MDSKAMRARVKRSPSTSAEFHMLRNGAREARRMVGIRSVLGVLARDRLAAPEPRTVPRDSDREEEC